MDNKTRVLSGMQPSGNGELHIGNYLGAAKQWVDLQNDHDSFYMIVDLHAITVPYEPAVLKENIYKIAALYLALGVDPAKSTIFVQSHLPAHSEMAWLLNTITGYGELQRMTQFKDKKDQIEDSSRPTGLLLSMAPQDSEQVQQATAGLFNYPVLMAADILLYQANLVPVGEDQKQHLELTRNLAERFNNRFGQTFTVPDYYAPENAARIMGLDNPTKKMSKSLGPDNYIGLLDDSVIIREKLKKAVTDSDGIVRFDKENKPAISNLLTIFGAVSGRSIQELEQEYANAGYGKFKDDLAEAVVAFLSPIQARYQTLINDRSQIDAILAEGAKKAATVAGATLAAAQEKMGLR